MMLKVKGTSASWGIARGIVHIEELKEVDEIGKEEGEISSSFYIFRGPRIYFFHEKKYKKRKLLSRKCSKKSNEKIY